LIFKNNVKIIVSISKRRWENGNHASRFQSRKR
jgi:hypothetical protein